MSERSEAAGDFISKIDALGKTRTRPRASKDNREECNAIRAKFAHVITDMNTILAKVNQ